MEQFFTIGEAAKAANTTPETLRHYDRIGLIKPGRIDPWTHYRYYTQQDIVRINTVRALQQMDLPLEQIRQVLGYDDLNRVIAFLEQAEKKADEKIAAIQQSKVKIQTAKASYQQTLRRQTQSDGPMVRFFPKRIILLSNTMRAANLDTLWNYLSSFYAMIPPAQRAAFAFEDMAGIYTQEDCSRMFAVCTRYQEIPELKELPEGRYLCADCTEENKDGKLNELILEAQKRYRVQPEFTVQIIVVSGILQWRYQSQVYLGA